MTASHSYIPAGHHFILATVRQHCYRRPVDTDSIGPIHMSLVVRKPVFGFSDQVRHSHRKWLEACNFGFRKKRNCTIRMAKTKELISFAVTAKLICVFVFAYAKSRFSHDAAQMNTCMSFSDNFRGHCSISHSDNGYVTKPTTALRNVYVIWFLSYSK